MKQWLWVGLFCLSVLLGGYWAFTVGGSPQVGEPAHVFSIALALGSEGLGDRSHNDGAYEGLRRGYRDLGVRYEICEYRGAADQTLNLLQLTQEDHDLIIAVGTENAAAVEKAAARFPKARFAVLGVVVDAPNVSSVVFRSGEGDFLAGVLCALLAPNDIVGFVGAAGSTELERIESAWRRGVLFERPDARVLAASGPPEDLEPLARRMIQEGARVIYAMVDAETAVKMVALPGLLLVSAGTDLSWVDPQTVVGGRVNNMEAAVYLLLEALRAGRLEAGTITLGVQSGGVVLSGPTSPTVPPHVSKRVALVRDRLRDGLLPVGDGR